MRLSPDVAARIKACRGVYSLSDTARHFNVSKDTVHNIWKNQRHTNVVPASEPENIKSTRVPSDIIVEDTKTLLGRGMNVVEAAKTLGVSKTRVYELLRQEGVQPCYFF